MKLIFCAVLLSVWFDPSALMAGGCVISDVKPASAEALDAILNTLTVSDQRYVVLGEDGIIDKDVINSHTSESRNFNALKALVNDRRVVEVVIANVFSFRDQAGKVQQGRLVVRYFNELERVAQYARAYTREQLLAMGFEDKMKRSGSYGITLVPGGEQDAGGDGMGSVNDNIFLMLSSDLTPRDVARTLAHEGYGHALFFIQGKDFNHAERKTDGGNKPLEDQINISVAEAERNFDVLPEH